MTGLKTSQIPTDRKGSCLLATSLIMSASLFLFSGNAYSGKHKHKSDQLSLSHYDNDEEQDLFGDSEDESSFIEIESEDQSEDSSEDIAVFGPDSRSGSSTHQPVSLSEYDSEEYLESPTESQIQEILSTMYNSRGELLEEMQSYVIGIKGQDRLLTLAEAYKANLLSPQGAGAILYRVRSFKDGETKTLHMKFGLRSGEDVVIGRYPGSMLARPHGNEAFHPGDPSLGPFVKWLELLGHLTWVNPLGSGSPAAINPTNQFGYQYSLSALAASINFNHFSDAHQRNLFGSAYTNPRGTGASLGFGGADSTHSFWYSIMHGWQGLGYTGLFNMEEQQLGLSALGVGAFVAGWKSYVQMGASLNAIFANGSQIGVGGVITLSKDRVTSYRHPYQGEYDDLIKQFISEYLKRRAFLEDELKVTKHLKILLDRSKNGPRSQIMNQELERLTRDIEKIDEAVNQFHRELTFFAKKHFIEVVDTQSKGFRLQGGAHINGFGAGFRGGVSKGKESIHRFYTPLDRAQELLKDGNGDKIALLRLPEKFDTEKFPDILKPHKWHIGEEVITTVERTFNGSIVMGMSQIPGLDAKIGFSGTVSGSFEIGIRKLPGNKLEVTLRPNEIKELGAFISTISAVGPQLSAASTVALAMRQTFIFDLDNQKSIDTYMLLMTGGVLPVDFSVTANIVGPREAENLLDIARISRDNLSKKGILLTYLEKIDVPAKRFYAGIAKLPCINSKHWAGLSYEYLTGQAKVISTNADLAVSRNTNHVQTSKGQGTSGTRTDSAYATIKRVFYKTDKSDEKQDEDYPSEDGYLWRFKGLILRARINDDKVTGSEHNEMIDKINSMFHANVNRFPKESVGHKQSRDILLERELTSKDLDRFSHIKQSTLETASRSSGIDKSSLTDLMAELEDKGHNQMANVVKEFIGKHGFRGVSAIHLMLGGNCRNLIIRTESSAYSLPLQRGNTLEALYTNPKADSSGTRYLDLSYDSNPRKIEKVFENVREAIADLDQSLEDLDEDPLYEGQGDLLTFGDSNLREKKCHLRSTLIAAKNRLLDLINLEKQDFPQDTILKIYKSLKSKNRDLKQRLTLLGDKYKRAISLHDKRKAITARWKVITELIEDIEREIYETDTEHNRKVLGVVWVDSRLNELQYLKRKARKIIAVDHLRPDAKAFIAKMTKKRAGIFSADPIHHTIAGHVQQSIFEHSESRPHQSRSPVNHDRSRRTGPSLHSSSSLDSSESEY